MIGEHINPEFDAVAPGGIPYGVGGRHYLQDHARDHYYMMDRLGLSLGDLTDQTKFLLSGGFVTQEAPVGDKEIGITAGVGYIKFSVQTRLSTAVPPTTQNEDVEWIRVHWAIQANVDASAATYDGATVNYVKIAYTELDVNTRPRAKAAGNWAYDQAPSFTITINSTAPTAYEICLTSFTAPAGGTMTFSDVAAIEARTSLLHTKYYEQENLLINGNFRFAQRGTSGTMTFTAATTPANNDDTYLLDRWNYLDEAPNDVADISQDTDIPGTRGLSMKSLVATINEKWGFVQFIENAVASELQGKTVSLDFWAKTTAGAVISNIRAGVIAWDGAVDTVTSDVVGAWNAAGANPTLVANCTFENTPANLALSTEWRHFFIDGIDIDTAGTNNVAVFIWVDDDDGAINDEMFLAEVNLTINAVAIPTKYRQFESELAKCQRFYEKSYDLNIAPGGISNNGALQWKHLNANDQSVFPIQFKVNKIAAGTTTFYSPDTGASGNVRDLVAPGDVAGALEKYPGQYGVSLDTVGVLTALRTHSVHFDTDSEL